ncbi:MAG: penicillin acylase family protein, partial [Sphingomonadales bacterium]
MKRKNKRISMFALTLLLALSAGGWVYIASSLPTIDGEMELSGLEAEVRVLRDEYGVPHIFATSEHDLYFSVGFVHAQDRLWQMEMNRRVAQGRLAEVVGVGALETDRFLRTIGVYERAKSA